MKKETKDKQEIGETSCPANSHDEENVGNIGSLSRFSRANKIHLTDFFFNREFETRIPVFDLVTNVSLG